jgi:diaminohydroxyphosphoribosylaminopyrimidine deaminase/5-amino-6-(5-phosphoribosylamino)uracil reductase
VRIVLDTALRLPETAALVRTARNIPLWVVAGPAADEATERRLGGHGISVLRCDTAAGRIDLAAMLRLLAGRGITRVMVEGGPTVAAAFIAAGLVDEVAIFRAPVVIGADGIDALEAISLSALTASPDFASRGIEALDADSLETLERIREAI